MAGAEIRKTVGFLEDPFEHLDGYLRKLERFSELGVDELMPNLSEIG
jgi:hypothetical protein